MWAIDFSNRLDLSSAFLLVVFFSAVIYGIGAIYEYYDGEKAYSLELKIVQENIKRMRTETEMQESIISQKSEFGRLDSMADIPESISGNCGAVKLQSNQKVQNQDGEHLIESWADKKNLISEGLLCEKKDNADPSISPLATKMNSKYDPTYDPFQLANAPPKIITNANPTRLAQKTPSASTEATSSSSPNRVKSILKRKPQITSDNVLDHLPLAIALPFRTADVVFDKATDGAAFIIKKTVINPVTTISSIFKPKRKYTTCRPNLNRRQSFSDGQPYPKMLPSQ